ncbi:Retrovirus-related Pol polyprotein from transposon 412, partial [Frankliniella fusca]
MHDDLKSKAWKDYVEIMADAFQSDNSMTAVLDRLGKMAQKSGETYKAFAHRVYNESRRANPPLPEEEVTRIMLKILPPSVATLMIGKNCKTVADFINQLERSIIERNIVSNASENAASANAVSLNEITDMFGKLLKKQENTENKILALLNGKEGTDKEDEEKEEDIETKISKGIYLALGNYNKRGGFHNGGEVSQQQNKETTLENNNFKEINVNRNNFELVEMPKDGSCFYHALSFGLYGTTKWADLLRQNIADHIKFNWDNYKNFIFDSDKSRYYKLHARSEEMATGVQMQAAADALQIAIRIKKGTEMIDLKNSSGRTNKVVWMLFRGPIDSGHFDALIPKETLGALLKENTGNSVGGRNADHRLPAVAEQGAVGTQEQAAVREKAAGREGVSRSPAGSERHMTPNTTAAGAVGAANSRAIRDRPKMTREGPSFGERVKTGRVRFEEQMKKTANPQVSKMNFQLTDIMQQVDCAAHQPHGPELLFDFEMFKKEDHFPVKVKVNGVKLIGFIDTNAPISVLSDENSVFIQKCEIEKGRILMKGETLPISGIFNPEIELSNKVKTTLPVFTTARELGVDLILGQNFLKIFQGEYAPSDNAYFFKQNGSILIKHPVQNLKRREWEFLILNISQERIGKLFKINIQIDGLDLIAAIDSGAVKTIMNTDFCTDKHALEPAKIKLRTANNTELKVDGIYRPVLKIENAIMNHPIICANLPTTIDILIGNDFLEKYNANISYEKNTASFKINGTTVTTKRMHENCEKGNKARNFENDNYERVDREQRDLPLYSVEDVIIPPESYGMVKSEIEPNILPAILTPELIMENPQVTSIECFLLDELLIPIFNCTSEPFFISTGTRLGFVEPDNQNIASNKIVETNLAEISYATNNNFIKIDEIHFENLECNLIDKGQVTSLPSLDNADLTEQQKSEVRTLCENYSDVFSEAMKPNATIPDVVGHLEKKNDASIFRRQWPLSAKQKLIAKEEIGKFLKLGIVEEGPTLVNLPFFVIEKRDSTKENPKGRLLYDSRLLNKALVKPVYKSYTIQDVLSYCSDKALLCTMDVVNYFFTIKMSEESRLLLGFTFENKSLRWARLPQGCSHSPKIAQIAMSIVLRNLPAIYFMDDILIGGTSYKSLLALFEQTLIRMRRNNLCLNPKKAILFQKTVPALGLIITAGECVKPDPKRFKPLLALKNPKNCAQLKSVICFFSYHRRYLKDFGARMQKYHDMTNEKIPFKWTEDDALEIENMYNYLLNNAVLALFDETLPTKLHVDASNVSVGAMLTQKRRNKFLTIGYFSAPILKSKLTWSSFHKECLGLYQSVKYFENELRLLEKFTVVSDCTSLKYLLATDSPRAPLDKFISYLSQFEFDFEFVPSEKNKIPDSLSRLDPPSENDPSIQIPDHLVTKLNVSPVATAEDKLINNRKSEINNDELPIFTLPDAVNGNVDLFVNDWAPITSFRGPFEFLSNFYPVKIFHKAKDWPSVEHAFQAEKAVHLSDQEMIRKACTPKVAKFLGKCVELRPDWEEIKLSVMLDLLLNKFAENTQLESQLLQTGNRHIVEENLWHDNFWGVCVCESHKGKFGQNMLGRLLCMIRSFKQNNYGIMPNYDDRQNMILGVTTRSKAKNLDDDLNIQSSSETKDDTRSAASKGSSVLKQGGMGRSADGRDIAFRRSLPGEQVATSPAVADDEKNVNESLNDWRKILLEKNPNIPMITKFSGENYFLSPLFPNKIKLDNCEYLSLQDALESKRLFTPLELSSKKSNPLITNLRDFDTPITIKSTLPQTSSLNKRIETLEMIRREVKLARNKALEQEANENILKVYPVKFIYDTKTCQLFKKELTVASDGTKFSIVDEKTAFGHPETFLLERHNGDQNLGPCLESLLRRDTTPDLVKLCPLHCESLTTTFVELVEGGRFSILNPSTDYNVVCEGK